MKSFFTGKSGTKFWINIGLMVATLVAVLITSLYMLGSFTHNGEKIQVPDVVGKSVWNAEATLREHGLTAMVVDSTYDKNAMRGAVLEQSPKAGYEVKSGRVVYMTVNLKGEPMVVMPDVVGNGSLREVTALLRSLGFKLTPHKMMDGQPKDLVLSVKQGTREIYAGQSVSRNRPLTLVVGGGEADSIQFAVDEVLEQEEIDRTFLGGDDDDYAED